jgi:divalent metal cation (Fe/Co/Zn/Cd) transporter
MENKDYLMGKTPEPALIKQIERQTRSQRSVLAQNTEPPHYHGNFIHVEIHVEVDKMLPTMESHKIGKDVERRVEGLKSIEKTFVHIDPV